MEKLLCQNGNGNERVVVHWGGLVWFLLLLVFVLGVAIPILAHWVKVIAQFWAPLVSRLL